MTSTDDSFPSARRRTTLRQMTPSAAARPHHPRLVRVAADHGPDRLVGDLELVSRQPVQRQLPSRAATRGPLTPDRDVSGSGLLTSLYARRRRPVQHEA